MTTNNEIAFGTCRALWTGEELTVGNDRLERRWRVENGLLFAASLRDRTTGREWLARPSDLPSPTAPAPDEPRTVTFSATPVPAHPTEEPSLVMELTAQGATLTLVYRFQIFPAAHGVTVQLTTTGPEAPPAIVDRDETQEGAPSGIETATPQAPEASAVDALEVLELAPAHLRLTQFTLHDRTDAFNELLHTNEWLLHTNERDLRLPGGLFALEDTLTGDGLIFLKLAPLPHARPVTTASDLRMQGKERLTLSGGGYPWVTLAYTGGAWGRTAALQAYQRQLRRYEPARDGQFLSNTWGDRSQDGRISAEFMAQEMDAAARLGVDIVQLDDGWQRGRTANSVNRGGVWTGFWASDPNFWDPHPTRFPDGLAPTVQLARARNMRLGLWFAPDSSDDFAHWERDAETLLGLYGTHGVQDFKIDGVKVHTERGEAYLGRFFERVLDRSGGRVTFDLDITAETRPGPFGLPRVGPLFVENRYTDWHGYWPHHTLRNLWKLAHVIDSVRLRMEFLNNARHAEKYPHDPLAPACYRPDYLFATVMFAAPLGWFEVSQLPEDYFAEVGPLVQVWKEHRAELFGGRIYPLGDAPDGTAWTGFISVAEDGRSAYLLLFRELNARPRWSAVALPPLAAADFTCTRLAGDGDVTLTDGRLDAHISDAQRFLFAQVTAR